MCNIVNSWGIETDFDRKGKPWRRFLLYYSSIFSIKVFFYSIQILDS